MRHSITSAMIRLIAASAIAILAAACNSDIFVEPVPDLENDMYYLECNGSSESFTIPTKGLRKVRFECDHPFIAGTSYFDENGEEIYDATLEKVARVSFHSPLFCLDFKIDGDNVEVKALDNTTPDAISVYIGLDYEHASRYIDFVIAPGQPLQITYLGFDIAKPVSGSYTERGIPHTFANNSDRTQRIVIYPFKEVDSTIRLSIEDYDFWARDAKGNVSLPFYTDGEWQYYSETNTAEVAIGRVTRFYSPDLNLEETFTVEVPPRSKVTTITEMTYATLDVSYWADLTQPGSGLTFGVQGQCKIKQPTSYKIEQR